MSFDEKTAKDAGDVIAANCKMIEIKLNIRIEMKKIGGIYVTRSS